MPRDFSNVGNFPSRVRAGVKKGVRVLRAHPKTCLVAGGLPIAYAAYHRLSERVENPAWLNIACTIGGLMACIGLAELDARYIDRTKKYNLK